jgi:ornithine decarboxylase
MARNRVYGSWNLWTRELPGIRPFYAVKCNPDRALLQQLSSYGAGFDCASGRELMEVADIPNAKEDFAKRVVYANPCKPLRDLQKAKSLGCPTTVIDSFEEVEKLKSVKWKGNALVRLLVEDKGSLMPFSRKFGIQPSKVPEISRLAAAAGIPLLGVSFHVGSGCKDSEQYRLAIKQSHDAIKVMTKDSHPAELIDIGGGFQAEEEEFLKHARKIRCSMYIGEKPVRYIAEPGRFFAESAFDLFVQVIGKKPSLDGSAWRYTIDESLYGQFSCIPFDHKVPTWMRIPTAYEGQDKPVRKRGKGLLFGRTCDSLDLIAKAEDMEELEVGDWLWFPNMGAYSSVTASEFNGFPKPPLHGVDHSLFLPMLKDVEKEHPHRFPKGVTTVTAVSLREN